VSYYAARLRDMAESLDVDLGPSDVDRRTLLEAAALFEQTNLVGVARLVLGDRQALVGGSEEMSRLEVFQAVLWLLRSLSDRGVDVAPPLELLAETLRSGDVSTEAVTETLRDYIEGGSQP
jgi:hypothetical protein